jgi:multidrug efflux pump subunit AcrA (membrane-fusion protein)
MLGGTSPRALKQLGGVSLALTVGVVMGVAAVSWPSGSGAKPTAMSWTATVGEGSVSDMVTATGVLAAATTTNLGFRTGNNLKRLNVKVGDKVKKGQLLAEEYNDVLRDTLIRDEQALANQREQLALAVRDVTLPVDNRIDQAAAAAVRQAERNIVNQERADQNAIDRARGVLHFDDLALAQAKAQARADGCDQPGVVAALLPAACAADKAAVLAAEQTVFNDRKNVIARKIPYGSTRAIWRARCWPRY